MFWVGLWLRLTTKPSRFSGPTSTWMHWYVMCYNRHTLHDCTQVCAKTTNFGEKRSLGEESDDSGMCSQM